ncbi:MAG: penicillin-binding protein 2 [Mycobacteriales bacterium]
MNAPIRKVAIAVLVLFGLLFINLNYVQVVQADKLRRNQGNQRLLLQTYERQRGSIVVDGKAIATSTATNDRLKYLRQYPAGPLYAPVTGYYSLVYGASAIERSEDSVLSGEDDRLFVRRVSDLVTGRVPRGGNVVLTLNPAGQLKATQLLGRQKGSVVALDPRTGAILAMVSSPSYDPNPLSSHDAAAIKAAWQRVNAAPGKPLLNRAINETYPIGSTMKVIVSAVALQNGYTPATMIPAPKSYTPPQTTRPLPNYDGTSCAGSGQQSLLDALRVSCNTAFAQLGVKLGADKLREQAAKFGVGESGLMVPMRVSTSEMGALSDPPMLAQSSIGQRDVRFTPLQNAMVAAAVANNGVLYEPHVVKEVQAPDLTTLDRPAPKVMSRPMTPEAASALQTMMRAVVDGGTGKTARIAGFVVGGKTGTAQNAGPDHGWFIGFAGRAGQDVPVAIAVVLENAGRGGSHNASTIAGQVMAAILASPGGGG